MKEMNGKMSPKAFVSIASVYPKLIHSRRMISSWQVQIPWEISPKKRGVAGATRSCIYHSLNEVIQSNGTDETKTFIFLFSDWNSSIGDILQRHPSSLEVIPLAVHF